MDPSARELAMFPLSTVLFPHASIPLHVFEPRYRTMVADCLAGEGEFGVVLIDRGSEVGGGDHRCAVGTVAGITESALLDDGRYVLMAEGRRRVTVQAWLPEIPYPRALALDLEDGPPSPSPLVGRAAAAVRRARALFSELGRATALGPEPPHLGPADDEVRGWWLCAQAPISQFDRQRLLETVDPSARLHRLVELADEVSADLARMLADGGP